MRLPVCRPVCTPELTTTQEQCLLQHGADDDGGSGADDGKRPWERGIRIQDLFRTTAQQIPEEDSCEGLSGIIRIGQPVRMIFLS
jgi:hypothetical protein